MPDEIPQSLMPAEDERKLHAAKIPAGVSEDEIRDVFSTYGNVISAELENTYADSRGTRSAIVIFDLAEDALSAMVVLNDMYTFGVEGIQPIMVKVAGTAGAAACPSETHSLPEEAGESAAYGSRSSEDQLSRYNPSDGRRAGRYDDACKIFAGSLPGDVTPEEIQTGFGAHGSVVDVHIMAGKSKSGQACAFITLSTAAEVDACVAAMNGYDLRQGAGPIEVKRVTDKHSGKSSDGKGRDSRGSDGRNGDSSRTSNWSGRDSGKGGESWSGGKDGYNGKDSYGKGYGKESYHGKDSHGPYGSRDYGSRSGKGSYGQEWWGGKDSYGKDKSYGGKDSYGKDSYVGKGSGGSYGKGAYGKDSEGGKGGGKACWQFKTGNCSYGSNCRYSHE